MWTSHDQLNKLFRALNTPIMDYIKNKELQILQSTNEETYCATKNKIIGLNFFKMFFIYYENAFNQDQQIGLVENLCVFIDEHLKEYEYLKAAIIVSSYLYNAVPVVQGVYVKNIFHPNQEISYLERISKGTVIPLVDPVILLLKLSELSRIQNLTSTSDALVNAFNDSDLEEIQNITASADEAANSVESQIGPRLSSPLPPGALPQAQPPAIGTPVGTPPEQMIPAFTVRSMSTIRRGRATRGSDAPSRQLDIPETITELDETD